jgi:hypothetical protein
MKTKSLFLFDLQVKTISAFALLILATVYVSFELSFGLTVPVDIIEPSFRIITFAAIFFLIQAGKN